MLGRVKLKQRAELGDAVRVLEERLAVVGIAQERVQRRQGKQSAVLFLHRRGARWGVGMCVRGVRVCMCMCGCGCMKQPNAERQWQRSDPKMVVALVPSC